MTATPDRRQRKKLEAMRHIQRTALDLFDAHGYANVTIERIAAESDVSPSSVYRYFGTKEQLVLYDEYDPMVLAVLDDRLAAQDPLTALRETLSTTFSEIVRDDETFIRRRMDYIMGEPALHAAMLRQTAEMEEEICQILARRTGREPGDLDVVVVTASIVGAFMAALRYWHRSGYREGLNVVIQKTLDRISGGLTLDP